MVETYQPFLAAVLNDNRIMTYRLLSRELKVHVNRAKEMLYDFHTDTNARKSGSCHATYIICGHRKPQNPNLLLTEPDGDTVMASSPYVPPESSPFVPTQPDPTQNKSMSIVLVPEEDLQLLKNTFTEITSIHVYSIEPTPLKDLLILADSTTEMHAKYADDEPAYRSKTYGMTHNALAKRRAGRKPIAPGPMNTKNSNYVAPVKVEKVAVPTTAKDMFANSRKKKEEIKTEEKEVREELSKTKIKEEAPTKATPASSKPVAPGSLKRGQSDLKNMFGKMPPKKVKKEDTPPPEPMEVDDDDEEEDTSVLPPAPIEGTSSSRQAKKEKDEELRRMMEDDDDDPIPDVPMKKEPIVEPTVKDEPDVSSTEASPALTGTSEPPKRRRAKRKVTKKVTSKDEEGYFVTKTETMWESYSEDDTPEPPKSKNAFSSMKGSGKAASKKTGNISDFFGRK